jgi:hypothetical protein
MVLFKYSDQILKYNENWNAVYPAIILYMYELDNLELSLFMWYNVKQTEL